MSIEAKKYVASDADIRALAEETIQARSSYAQTKSTYLRALIGTTQARIRDEKVATENQWRILKEVHQHFYAIVKEAVITDDIKKGGAGTRKDEQLRRTLERNRRSNFARTANSTLTGWLKVEGHDLMDLKAATVLKDELAAASAPRKPHTITQERAQARATKYVDGLLNAIKPYASQSQEGARAVLEEAIKTLTNAMRMLKPGQNDTSLVTMTRVERARAARLSKKAA